MHGITTQVAREKGLDLADVMKHFQGSLLKAEKVIAHNLQFDEKIVGAEFLRCQLPNPIESMPRACTMLASTDLCQLQHLQVRPGRLWCKYEKVATRDQTRPRVLRALPCDGWAVATWPR